MSVSVRISSLFVLGVKKGTAFNHAWNPRVIMPMKNKQRWIHVALAPNHPSQTKGVVIMYGWLGSSPSHVELYAKLYQKLGCTVVYDIASFSDAMLRNESKLTALASKSVLKAAHIIREVETVKGETSTKSNNLSSNVPVILHYFSNGGAFVAERLRFLINDAKSSSTHYLTNEQRESLIMISDRLYEKGFEVADSAPADLNESAQYRAIESAIPNKFLQSIVKALTFIAQSVASKFIITHEELRSKFWNNMIENDLCMNQAFIYSTKDQITDADMIDKLIEERKLRGINVISAKFNDSDHVMHFKYHPKEYSKVLDQVTRASFERSSVSKEQLSEV